MSGGSGATYPHDFSTSDPLIFCTGFDEQVASRQVIVNYLRNILELLIVIFDRE